LEQVQIGFGYTKEDLILARSYMIVSEDLTTESFCILDKNTHSVQQKGKQGKQEGGD
jgi:hypothetical protein